MAPLLTLTRIDEARLALVLSDEHKHQAWEVRAALRTPQLTGLQVTCGAGLWCAWCHRPPWMSWVREAVTVRRHPMAFDHVTPARRPVVAAKLG